MKISLRDIVVALILLFILSAVFIVVRNHDKKVALDIMPVDNSTQYYDISGMVNKFVRNSNDDNVDVLIELLDDSFKEKKHINKGNIFHYVKKYSDNNISFFGDKMYYEEISGTFIKAYVSGTIQTVLLYDSKDIEKYYVIVLVDRKKKLFSIIPDDGTKYKEAEKWLKD